MSEQERRPLVVDTSVAVKFYVLEEGREHALRLLSASHSGEIELLAPGTLLAEGFNAVWQQYRRKEMDLDEVRDVWASLERAPVVYYPPEELIRRAGEITAEIGAIVYDALFLARYRHGLHHRRRQAPPAPLRHALRRLGAPSGRHRQTHHRSSWMRHGCINHPRHRVPLARKGSRGSLTSPAMAPPTSTQ